MLPTLQVRFDCEGTLKAVLSTKNFKGKTGFSQAFQGKVAAAEFIAIWMTVTKFDNDKAYRVVAGNIHIGNAFACMPTTTLKLTFCIIFIPQTHHLRKTPCH